MNLRAALTAMRPHQWAKNALLFVPALAAHRALDGVLALTLGAAFASLSLLASAVYLVNDIVDAEHDRAHPRKRNRPIASGRLGVGPARVTAAILTALSLAVALRLPRDFVAVWGTYVVLTTAYSAGLKRAVVLDVVVLASLFTARVVAGAAAVSVPLSRWFLAFSVFVFTSLALLKRAAEAVDAGGEDASLRGRGWRAGDLPVLAGMGMACAAAAALVYCLYITGDDVVHLYARPDILWGGLPVLLYWLCRAWLLTVRGEMHDDPVMFALRDPPSWASLAVFALVVWGAT